MKRLLAMIFCLLAYIAQAQSQTQKVTLELGSVTVWLGEPKQKIFADFADSGLVLDDAKDGMVFVHPPKDYFTGAYTMRFSADKLVFADRTWTVQGVEPIQAAVNAFASLASHGATQCTFSHDTKATEVGLNYDRVFVTCGQRSILLMNERYNRSEDGKVMERIGTM